MIHAKTYIVFYFIVKCVRAWESGDLNTKRDGNDLKLPKNKYKWIEIDLDGKIDENQVEISNVRPYDIGVRHFNLKAGLNLAKVAKSGQEIWLNAKGLECVNVAVAYQDDTPLLMCVNCTDAAGKDEQYYMVNDSGSWLALRDRSFYSIFKDFVVENIGSRSVDLNLAGRLSDDDFYVNSSDQFPFMIVVPNVSAHVSRVYSGNSLVWEAPSSRLLYLSLFKRAEQPLLCIITSALTLYMANRDDKWVEISKQEYDGALRGAGIDLSSFDNSVGLDIGRPDEGSFIVSSFGSDLVYFRKLAPRPGLRLTRIFDSEFGQGRSSEEHRVEGAPPAGLIWSSPTDHCVYVGLNVMDGVSALMSLYIRTPAGQHRIEYLVRVHDGSWRQVGAAEFHYALLNNRLPPHSPHPINPTMLRSQFRNRQGLQIQTYCSKANLGGESGTKANSELGDGDDGGDGNGSSGQPKSKGAFVLVHGNREYFVSNFLNYDMLWNFKHFGYPSFPHINAVHDFELTSSSKKQMIAKFDSLFSPNSQSPADPESAQEVAQHGLVGSPLALQRFQYECSLVGVLNEMGFDVYGMDMQSFGLSESVSDSRCYFNDFEDLVDDLLQFLDIVKRGRFSDPTQSWYPDVYSMGTEPLDDRLFLLGYSMGANVVFQAAQKFTRLAQGPFNFVNGIVSLSGMMKIDHNFSGFFDKMFSLAALGVLGSLAPRSQLTGGSYPDWTKKMSDYLKLCDGFYYSKSYTSRTVSQLFKATRRVMKGMEFYPKNVPTLFVHSENDPVCSIEGPLEIYHSYLKQNQNTTFIRLKGNSHETPSPLFIYNFIGELRQWIETVCASEQPAPPRSTYIKRKSIWDIFRIVLYLLVGSVVKTLVIFLVLRYRKRNRALADEEVSSVDCIVH